MTVDPARIDALRRAGEGGKDDTIDDLIDAVLYRLEIASSIEDAIERLEIDDDELRRVVKGHVSDVSTVGECVRAACELAADRDEAREELEAIDQDALEAGQDLAEHGLTRDSVHTALWRARLITLSDDPWDALARGLGV